MAHDHHRTASTPSKGKAKGDGNWQLGWCDFYPLMEQARRPVQWSPSSTIFTAHATQPLVVARIFDTTKQFLLPSPIPIVASPASYKPPTVISVAPGDGWLFAYFPGHDCEGIGCLWLRGPEVDNWIVKEVRNFVIGGGVVTASWAGGERELVMDPSGSSTRLPVRGPPTPDSGPTLLLVTEHHQLHAWYQPNYDSSIKSLSCALLTIDAVADTQNRPSNGPRLGPGGVKLCISAAIGLGYGELSILIAMRSRLCPPISTQNHPPFVPINMNLALTGSVPSEATLDLESECWGEESYVELAAVQLRTDGVLMTLVAAPLPPILQPQRTLTQLLFICTPPLSPPLTTPPSRKDSQVAGSGESSEAANIYLAASFLDFGDYASHPTSTITLHSIARNAHGGPARPIWCLNLIATRQFSSSIVSHMIPGLLLYLRSPALCAVVLETSGTFVAKKQRIKEAQIGRVIPLKLSDLSNNFDWDPSPIVSRLDGGDLPLTPCVSPNGTLLCMASSSFSNTHTSVHPFPRWISTGSDAERHCFALPLARALRARTSTADITHLLAAPSTCLSEVTNTLYATISSLDADPNGLLDLWVREVVGVALEIYRKRALKTEHDQERNVLRGRWQVGHDICSLIACNAAFEECRDLEGYDLAAVWQLVTLSIWVVNSVERLMKDCVSLLATSIQASSAAEENDDLFGSHPSSPVFDSKSLPQTTPGLVYLVQSFTLTYLHRVLGHVTQFRAFLGSLSVSAENAQMAKDILVDSVDCSGVDLAAVQAGLVELIIDCKAINVEDSRKSLVSCQPIPSVDATLRKMVQKLLNSPAVDKPRLFLKPMDLLDGASPLPSPERHPKDRDVISKALLANRGPTLNCLRCGGNSEIAVDVDPASPQWGAWEKSWMTRCVCGGYWVTGSKSMFQT